MGTSGQAEPVKIPVSRAVFLDRDGVINRAVVREGRAYPPATLEDFKFLPRVDEAIRDLKGAGFKIIVATNQPDVATGIQSRRAVESMHRLMEEKLRIDAVKVCYHQESDGCDCRKPKPGMILEAAREHGLDLARSFFVGDRWRDVEAGRAAGCFTIWIASDYREKKPENPDAQADSLWEASRIILSKERVGGGV